MSIILLIAVIVIIGLMIYAALKSNIPGWLKVVISIVLALFLARGVIGFLSI